VGYKADQGGAKVLPDVPAFPLVEADRRVLLPCPDAENIRRAAVCWSDAVHAAARLVCPDTGAILEGRPDRMALGAEKLAVRELLPEDAAQEQTVSHALLAWADALAEHWRPEVSAAAEPCKQAVDPSAA
jgi:hypothetical protein